jgi:hypothetical protein
MVCQDGKYAGYTPIFQGDNAGPDQDSKFLYGVKGYVEKKAGIGSLKQPRCLI